MVGQQNLISLVEKKYRVRISGEIRHLVESLPADAAERLSRQFYPAEAELVDAPGFAEDPLQEEDSDIHPLPDIIHKYPNKLLYLTTNECPVFCRYCTRKRKTLKNSPPTQQSMDAVIEYVKQHPQINEVIFSGGDPFMLPDKEIMHLALVFARLPQVRYLRWHTRTLTTLPQRWKPSLFAVLQSLVTEDLDGLYLVTHINTAEELTETATALVARLRGMGFNLLNQAVLLKGVNDEPEILKKLLFKLARHGIRPYYLHQLDRVEGASHFEVPVEHGREIFEHLRQSLPVALLPRYVKDTKKGKINLAY